MRWMQNDALIYFFFLILDIGRYVTRIANWISWISWKRRAILILFS